MTDKDKNTTTSSNVNKGYYYYKTNTKNENQNCNKIAIINIGSPQLPKAMMKLRKRAREEEGSNQETGTGRRKSSVLRNNLVWLFAKREEEKDSPSLHPSNQEDATITLRTINVIISVVRKGGKKRKRVPRVWTVGEKAKKEEAKARRGARNRQKEETGIIDSKGKILDAFKREETSTRRWRCKFFK
jgi:hypothetical protein